MGLSGGVWLSQVLDVGLKVAGLVSPGQRAPDLLHPDVEEQASRQEEASLPQPRLALCHSPERRPRGERGAHGPAGWRGVRMDRASGSCSPGRGVGATGWRDGGSRRGLPREKTEAWRKEVHSGATVRTGHLRGLSPGPAGTPQVPGPSDCRRGEKQPTGGGNAKWCGQEPCPVPLAQPGSPSSPAPSPVGASFGSRPSNTRRH